MDGFGEPLLRAHGPAKLLGEGWPLIWGGQPFRWQRRVDAADKLVEGQFCRIVDCSARHLESGHCQRVLVPLLALLVGPACGGGPGAQPAGQELAHAAGPVAVLEPQRRPVGHHCDAAARA